MDGITKTVSSAGRAAPTSAAAVVRQVRSRAKGASASSPLPSRKAAPRAIRRASQLGRRRATDKSTGRRYLAIAVGAHAAPRSFVGAELSITLALHAGGRRGFPRLIHERIPRLTYRNIRGSPKCGKRLVSGNQVSADI